jgi:hypothetical protein
MAGSEVPRVRVAVRLSPPADDIAEWLADAAAFDAAGADALWVDLRGAPDLDPVVLTAGLATVTFRCLLVAGLPDGPDRTPERSRSLATLARLSRGRLRLVTGADGTAAGSTGTEIGPADIGPAEIGPADIGPAEFGAADVDPADAGAAEATGAEDPIAQVTGAQENDARDSVARDDIARGHVARDGDARDSGARDRVAQDSVAQDSVVDDAGPRHWAPVPVPADRAAWRATLLGAVERGVAGVLVPADPRLLDLLRNPGDEGDRRDLHLSVG